MTESPSYDDDFEPLCHWIRTKECDTLVLHLPKFKNEELKIQVVTDTKVLKISGERALKPPKRSRFCKEVEVYPSKISKFSKEVNISKECNNVYDIHAEFVKDRLNVTMPKNISETPPQPVQTDPNPKGKTSPDDKFTKPPTSNKESSLPSENAAAAGKTATNGVSTRKSCSKVEKFFPCWRLCCL